MQEGRVSAVQRKPVGTSISDNSAPPFSAAAFDVSVGTLSSLKKLQDQSKYRKAFSFKLYRRPL